MLVLRISSFIVLLLLAVFAPWFLVAGAALVAAAVFPWFWENIVIGFLLGSIYGFSGGSLLFAFLASGFTASFLVEEYSKRLIEGKNALSYALIVFSGGIAIFLFWLAFKIALYV